MRKYLVMATSVLIVAGCSQPTPPAESPADPTSQTQPGEAPNQSPPSAAPSATDLAELTSQNYPVVQRGVTLSAKGPASAARPYLVSGWSADEQWGVWSVGDQARMGFRLDGAVDRDVEIVVAIKGFVTPTKDQVTVVPSANGRELAPIVLSGNQDAPSRHTIVIPSQDVTAADGRIRLDFQIQDPRSPEQVGMSKDKRMLGIGLVEVSVK